MAAVAEQTEERPEAEVSTGTEQGLHAGVSRVLVTVLQTEDPEAEEELVLLVVVMAGLAVDQAGNGAARVHPAPEADIQAGQGVIRVE